MTLVIKYLMEILAVSAAAFMLLKNQQEALTIGLVSGLTFLILDYFMPAVSDIARKGVGLGFGLMMVGGGARPARKTRFSEGYKMIPTCPDPNNSGKALLAGYDEGVSPANVQSLTSWPFAEAQVIPYGTCNETIHKKSK